VRGGAYGVLVGKLEVEKNYFENLDVNGRIILRWVFIRMRGRKPD
jgi:hypothetical protein